MISKLENMIFQMVAGANVATVIIMLLIGYSDRVNPASAHLLANAGLAYPIFLIINLLFLVFWSFVKIKWVVIPMLGFVFSYLPTRNYCPLNLNEDTSKTDIKVLSYNVWGFGIYGAGNAKDSVNYPIPNYIAEQGADIVCLQEAGEGGIEHARIEEVIYPLYQYRDTLKMEKSGDVLAFYSRFPIIKKERIPFESNGNLAGAVWLDVAGDTVIVVNAHFETTGLDADDKAHFKHMVKGDYAKDSVETTSKQLYTKLKEATLKRAPQAEAVARFIALHSDKTIICCGDFNDGPNSYTHQTIADKLTDCYVAAGNGPGISYHKGGFYVRIDNIFCSTDLEPLKCIVDNKIATSDHYPIICWLKKR